MSGKEPVPYDATKGLGVLTELMKRFRLMWLLFWDKEVPFWAKLVVPISLIYLISPVDFIPRGRRTG